MGPLPPPTVPTNKPPDGAWGLRATTYKIGGLAVWSWALIAAGVAVAAVMTFSPDKPDAPSRSDAANRTWAGMTLTEQAAICDGYNLAGSAFTVDSLMVGTGGNEDDARALLDVIKREC